MKRNELLPTSAIVAAVAALALSATGYANPTAETATNSLMMVLGDAQDSTLQALNAADAKTATTLDSALTSLMRSNADKKTTDALKSAVTGTASALTARGMVPIVAVAAAGQVEALRASASALGMTNITVVEGAVHGRLPLGKMSEFAALGSLRFARHGGGFNTNVGSVTSQGDGAMKSNVVRQRSGLTGAGVKVGILSDTYNALGSAPLGVTSGNLPGPGNPNGFAKPVRVLNDGALGTDEGRAMAEIVHDVAPGAELSFWAATELEAEFAEGIRRLAADGAKIIVDDVSYLTAPQFQDGLIARAVDEVVAKGVTYFSSAGNSAREAYESQAIPGLPVQLKDSDGTLIGTYRPHQFFTPQGGLSSFLKVDLIKTSEGPRPFVPVLQWNEPWASLKEGAPGSKTDWDLFIFSEPDFSTVIGGSASANIGRDPIELSALILNGPVGSTGSYYIAIMAPESREFNALPDATSNLFALTNRLRLYFPRRGTRVVSTSAALAGTIAGHANSAGAIATCAAQYNAIDSNGRYVPQSFTSVGGVVVRVDKNGFPTYQDRQKPDLCGPDGGNTSFFAPNGPNDFDNDGFPNFNGTSASAPHIAAVGALMKEARPDLTPNQIRYVMKATARDMKDPYSPFDFGQDKTTGAGFIDADRALRAIGR